MEPGVSAIVRCPHSWAHDTSICHHRQQWCTGAAPRPLATTSWSFGYPTIRYPGSRGKKCSECGVNICLIAPRGPVVTLHHCHYVTPIQWPAPPSTGIYSPQWRIFSPAANGTLHSELLVLFISIHFSPFSRFPNFSAIFPHFNTEICPSRTAPWYLEPAYHSQYLHLLKIFFIFNF